MSDVSADDVPISEKVAHVLDARSKMQTRAHGCHWPGCTKQVPPAMWGCTPHWMRLPQQLRRKIWLTYRPGQENLGSGMSPSAEYFEVARAVQTWIRDYGDASGEKKEVKA